MSPDAPALDAFETRIAAATRNDEPHLFGKALELAGSPAAEISAFCARGAFADAAILIHRAWLPGHGYQLGETGARKGLASTWRRGDAQTLPFEAATPGLALLRATTHAVAHRIRKAERAACPICSGLGWTITRTGGKRLCRHGR